MSTPIEAGLRKGTVHFVRETTRGATPSNPAWRLFGDTVENFSATPEAALYMRRGLGSPYVLGFTGGSETHSLNVNYQMQRFLAGNDPDASADGFLRDVDNRLANSHSILQILNIHAGGAQNQGRRIFTVVKGAVIGQATLSGTPGSGQPNTVALEYSAESIRSYLIEKPAATAASVAVVSSNAADTTQKVRIANGATSEEVTLTGTTAVSTTATWSDIDGISIDAETEGDIEVSQGTGTSKKVLCVIYGKDSYQGRQGDLGVPFIGTGSFESSLSSVAYESFVGSRFERPVGTSIGEYVMGIELTVNNSLENKPRATSPSPIIYEGDAEVTFTANVFGTADTHDKIMQHLRIVSSNFRWFLTNPKKRLNVLGAVVSSPGARELQPSQAVMERGVQFTGTTLTANIEPPLLSSATVDGSSLVLTFDEPLDTGSVSAASAFTVSVAGSARTVSSVAVAGTAATLTLSSAVTSGQAVTAAYTVPSTNPLQSAATETPVATFAATTVTNNTS